MKNLKLFCLVIFLTLFSFNVTTTTAQEGSSRLAASLAGNAVVSDPGDGDGSGNVTITVNPGQSELCFELSVTNIAAATAAHIYEGAAGKAGQVVVTLTPPADGFSKDCIKVDMGFIKRIRQTPENFYVSVHNAEFPNGAIRGQLSR